jgi:hypothetical protein
VSNIESSIQARLQLGRLYCISYEPKGGKLRILPDVPGLHQPPTSLRWLADFKSIFRSSPVSFDRWTYERVGPMSATAVEPIPVELTGVALGPLVPRRIGATERSRQASAASRSIDVSRPARSWRWGSALADGVQVLALVWSVPFAVLAVGIPIALAIALLLRVARLALSGF